MGRSEHVVERLRSITGRNAAGLVATALLLLPTGCVDEARHGTPSRVVADQPDQAARHNDADVAFLQGMIPHHWQAAEMAALAGSRARNGDVKALAEQIKQVQAAEVTQLSGWLTEWNEPVPSASPPGHSGHGGVPTMASAQDLADLEQAEGAEFDRMFLEMMISHHQGALQMAVIEQRQGQHAGAKELATRIEKAQGDEIEQMRRAQPK
jgi:uncharacterized protein (DUF305 family)